MEIPVYTYKNYRTSKSESSRYIYQYESQFGTSSNVGILFIAKSLSAIEKTILQLAEEHLHCKIVLVLETSLDIERESIEFKLWNLFYQLHVYVIDKNQNVVTLFNPFQHLFHHLPINIMNFSQSTRYILEIVSDRRKNLHGYKIDTFMFDMRHVSEAIRNKSGHVVGYDLVDGGFLNCLMEYFRFTPNFVHNNISIDKIFSKASGIFSVIENGEAMLSSNARLVLNYSTNNTVLLYPTDAVKMFYVVPVSYQHSNLNIFVFDLFSATAKWSLISSILSFIFIWTVLQYCYNKLLHHSSPNNIIIVSIAILNNISTQQPAQLYNRILFISLTLFIMVISNTYQGTITTQLSIKSTPRQINTLTELLDSNLKISTVGYLKDFLIASPNRSERHIWNLLIRKPGVIYPSMTEGMSVVAYNQTDALLMPDLFIGPYRAEIYDNLTGRDLIRAIPQSPIQVLISFVVSKQCPFTKEFNTVLFMYKESGLKGFEVQRAMFRTKLLYIKRFKFGQYNKDTNRMQSISLQDIRTLFLVWSNLIIVSCLAFLGEIIYYHFMEKLRGRCEIFERQMSSKK